MNYRLKFIGMMMWTKSLSPTGLRTPGSLAFVVSSATCGVSMTLSASDMNLTLKAISIGIPSTLASTWATLSPVSLLLAATVA